MVCLGLLNLALGRYFLGLVEEVPYQKLSPIQPLLNPKFPKTSNTMAHKLLCSSLDPHLVLMLWIVQLYYQDVFDTLVFRSLSQSNKSYRFCLLWHMIVVSSYLESEIQYCFWVDFCHESFANFLYCLQLMCIFRVSSIEWGFCVRGRVTMRAAYLDSHIFDRFGEHFICFLTFRLRSVKKCFLFSHSLLH